MELKKEVISWVKTFVFAFVFAIAINRYVIVNGEVPTGSMTSTINIGDHIIGLRTAYLFSGPQRYDIITFEMPDDPEDIYVKRIIGLPGEKVEIIGGKVYIDDGEESLTDYFINEQAYGDYGPFYVPMDHYFVLGDNRNNSWDSKNWNNHYVPMDNILGKVVFKFQLGFGLFEHVEE